jgi:short subunit dehydrogenase-like uncharacterized protein
MKLAIYGANGYQGKIVTQEAVRRGIDVVLVGRSSERLREAARAMGGTASDLRVADTVDIPSLVTAFRGVDAVVNCAGPFTVSGVATATAAVTAGCHYVDTAGEQLYVKSVFDTLADTAQTAGVSVVPAMNDDNLPASLIAQLAADEVGAVAEVVIAIRLEGEEAASRGSLRSALQTLDVLKSGGLSFEDGAWRSGAAPRRTTMSFPDTPEPLAIAPFPLPPVITVPRHLPARRVSGFITADVVAAFDALTAALVESLPEGPSADRRVRDRFTVVTDVLGEDGRTVRGVVRGTDTYGTTAVIAVEAARRLVVDKARPGVLAPAEAFAPKDFLEFLTAFGVRWSVEDTRS